MGPRAGGRGQEAPPRTLGPLLPGAPRRRDPAAWKPPPAATTTGPGARGPGPPPRVMRTHHRPRRLRHTQPEPPLPAAPAPPARGPQRPRPSLAGWRSSLHPRAARSAPAAGPSHPAWALPPPFQPPPHPLRGPLAWRGQLPCPPRGPSCRFRPPALVWVECLFSGQCRDADERGWWTEEGRRPGPNCASPTLSCHPCGTGSPVPGPRGHR